MSFFGDPVGWGFVASVAVFLGLEGYALVTKTVGDTFSERVWAWLAGRVRRPAPSIDRALYNIPAPPHIRVFATRTFDPAQGTAIVRHGIRWNTFRWFSAAWFTLGLFIWLWTHFFLGWFAG